MKELAKHVSSKSNKRMKCQFKETDINYEIVISKPTHGSSKTMSYSKKILSDGIMKEKDFIEFVKTSFDAWYDTYSKEKTNV